LVKEDIIKQKIYDAAKKVANELSSQVSVKNSLASAPQKNNFLKDPYIKIFKNFLTRQETLIWKMYAKKLTRYWKMQM
jgi:hypothetical protein